MKRKKERKGVKRQNQAIKEFAPRATDECMLQSFRARKTAEKNGTLNMAVKKSSADKIALRAESKNGVRVQGKRADKMLLSKTLLHAKGEKD